MEVQLGSEGGKSVTQAGFGLLEVKVESRNCVVTETKTIAGQIVASRSYPDPGCKLPEQEKPFLPPAPEPGPNGVEIPDTDEQIYAVITQTRGGTIVETVNYWPFHTTTITDTSEATMNVSNIPDEVPPPRTNRPVPFFVNKILKIDHVYRVNYPNNPSANITDLIDIRSSFDSTNDLMEFGVWRDLEGNYNSSWGAHVSSNLVIEKHTTTRNGQPAGVYTDGLWGGVWAGKASTLRKLLALEQRGDGGRFNLKTIVSQIIPVGKQKPVAQFLPTGNTPPMNNNCCEEILDLLDEFKEVLALKEFKTKKISIPGEMIAIQTEGMPAPPDEIISNYPQMLSAILLAVNRYGIDAPITAIVEDSDLTKAGKQENEFTYTSPGTAIKAILELLLEMKAENGARLEIQVRLASAITRTLKIAAGVSESVSTIIKMLGIPVRPKQKSLPLEFNLFAGKKGKGFAKAETSGRSAGSETQLESILPNFLKDSQYELPAPTFNPDDDDIRELLVKILVAVQSGK
ncbi:hypothetical protein [Microcoleus sp. bin38.metabat.b11b12b14.051]|uniref:hypothetical protein n=1 Tax=Microcoleus sp. bin38.metabat.b11b12b14.051 TaxID=2742709 RepID=UPI0026010A9A|nr:hypothetical protein [Microcoleus sp. bin38.metabat.b11b12b14.051]